MQKMQLTLKSDQNVKQD